MTDPFLAHRKAQEAEHAARADPGDPMASLVSVELNVMDGCNRSCRFCPHGDIESYPNRVTWRMSPGTALRVASDLRKVGWRGRMSLSGYGEPLLHKDIAQIVRYVRRTLPDATIEMNTNGDVLSQSRIELLDASGLDWLYVNLYDGQHQAARIDDLFAASATSRLRYHLRPHWDGAESFGLELNNRSGAVHAPELALGPRAEPWMGQRCHYPFYKAFVDWNGDVLFCSNDWGRAHVVGNVHTRAISDIWLSEAMRGVRERLAAGDRSCAPCAGCSVNGTLHGRFSFDLLMRHYGVTNHAEEQALSRAEDQEVGGA